MSQQKENLEWLIRDGSNVIRGPYGHSEVLNLIKKGQLKAKTEIARSNSYWFSLEEKVELNRFFPELGGGQEAEQPTQMTATLTRADVEDRNVDITQFTASPSRSELAKPASQAPGGGQAQWLSDEFAEEFGDFGESLGVEGAAAATQADAGAAPHPANEPMAPMEPGRTPVPAEAPARPAAPKPAPKAERAQPVIEPARLIQEVEEPRRRTWIFALVGVAVLGGLGFFLLEQSNGPSASAPSATNRRVVATALEPALRRSLVLFDLEGAREALGEMESAPDFRGQPIVSLAQALVKKEFLFDTDGALGALQTARGLANEPKLVAEVENLQAQYGYEREPGATEEAYRRLVSGPDSDPVFRYNYALSLNRSGRPKEAIAALEPIFSSIGSGDALAEDAAVLLGWARELGSRGTDRSAEGAFQRALEANPNSAKARIGLALHRLRSGGIRSAENDFRVFIDALTEIDNPTRVTNFRRMSDFAFYRFARAQIAELNVPMPGGPVGTKPSPLVMAADAILASLLSQGGEAKSILADAARAAPGDAYLTRAMGYLMWKEGKAAEILDLFKDRDRGAFAVNILLGKSYLKQGRSDLAARHFTTATQVNPSRGDGWSLLGDALLGQKQEAEALRAYQEAHKRDPLDLGALRGLHRLGQSEPAFAKLPKVLPF